MSQISKKDSDEMFETAMLDPHSWADQARLLKTSAQLSWDELIKVSQSNLPPNERSQVILSYMQSYMMLSGIALENIIKGLHVARLPIPRLYNDLLSLKILHHNLLKLVPSDVVLSIDETNLLSRLETFTVWAGRYPMPTGPDKYHNAVVNNEMSLSGKDYARINEIFFKFDHLFLQKTNENNE